ncbi:MAG: SHD1 domain-containing protein [Rubripirellula sp.]
MRMTILWLLVLFTVVCGPSDGREWVDSTGKFRIEADLVALRGDKVILETEAGKIVALPISRLSVADRKFLQEKTKPTSPASSLEPPASKMQPAPTRSPEHEDSSELAGRAFEILSAQCVRCHGKDESNEGGFGFALDREKLVSSGYVLPKDPLRSPLLERMTSKGSPMPPAGESPRPSTADIKVIREWIQAGAASVTQEEPQVFITTEQMYARVSADLKKVAKRDRPFARYFSVTHLANAGVSKEELATYRLALAKLVNSLSWNRQLADLKSLGSRNDLFRVDLRDLKWTADDWKQVLSYYPHGLVFESRDAFNVRTGTDCEVPVVRADWFVSAASRPPLYHELAQIPSTDKRLEDLLRVNVKANIEQGRTVRAGFARSGVSQNNRLVERHESIFGAYWKSYDFAGNTGRKNLFENPLGPGAAAGTFAHDGGEIIFRLPNGMLGYMLTDQFGRRIDRGPIEIVSDPRQPDRTVVNGVSCMSCHYGGFIQKTDEIRNHVLANQTAYRNFDEIMGLYAEPEAVGKWIQADTRDYLSALAKDEIGLPKPTKAGEPIVLIANRYQNEVDLSLAAAELGLQPQAFDSQLKKIADDTLRRTVGAFKTRGGVVKRQAFDQVFVELATVLGLGIRSGAPPARVPPRSVAAVRPGRGTARSSTMREPVPAEAEKSLRSGIEALNRGQWQAAEDEFAIALQLSSDGVFVGRVFEHAIRLYERGESATRLIEAHRHLLDLCKNPEEIIEARTRFFASLFRFANKSESPSWRTRSTSRIDWKDKLPTSVSTAVAAVFEEQLKHSPEHEPALRVMQTYWQRVYDNPQKRTPIMVKLHELYRARGEQLDATSVLDLMFLMAQFGDPKHGAEVLAEMTKDAKPALAGMLRTAEAEAWNRADEKEKALTALKTARRVLQADRGSNHGLQLAKVGDVYMSLGEPVLAKEVYRSALRNEKNAYQVRTLQEKVAKAVDATGGNAEDGDEKMDALLDPALSFRMEAENQEKIALRSGSYYSFVQAANSWIKADEKTRAAAALKKAAEALRATKVDSSTETYHSNLAKLYRQIDRGQEACGHLIEALKHSRYDHSVEDYQARIDAIVSGDDSVKIAASAQEFIDANYKFRVEARKHEAQQMSDPRMAATYLIKAAQQWSQAGDAKEVTRVGLKAESAIKKMVSTSTSSFPQERLHRDLAQAYEEANLFEGAVRNYVDAIGFATSDDEAVKHHQRITVLCEANGLALPKLDPESALKLDPLNRFRVDARDYEEKAEKATTMSSKTRYWKSASERWLKANEHAEALRTADIHAGLVMKDVPVKEYDLERLAKLYEAIGNKERAIQALEKAITVSKSDYQVKRFRERISALQ